MLSAGRLPGGLLTSGSTPPDSDKKHTEARKHNPLYGRTMTIDTTDEPFAGVYPAITTPFHEDGSIDFETLRADVRRLVTAGVDGIVPCGSTGESATLTHDEHIEVVEATVDAVEEVPVIAGAGSNATHEAVSLSRRSEAAGADALLHISPYYNNPEPAGMENHYRRIADAVDIPIIVYNVPGRTGRDIDVETTLSLAEHPNITGYKAASGDTGKISEIIERTREEEFSVISGDDGMTYPILAAGGVGTISVAANVRPAMVSDLVGSALSGDHDRAREIHHRLGPLFRTLFIETNPIPVKEAMAMAFDHSPHVRSPLSRLAPENREELAEVLNALPEGVATA
jgi:4-hydroxy-tetrahydrodipicolinate synthase